MGASQYLHPALLQISDSGSSYNASITQNPILFQMVIHPIPHQIYSFWLFCVLGWPGETFFLIPVFTKPVLCPWLLSGQWHSARAGSTRAPPYKKPLSPMAKGKQAGVVTFTLTETHPAFA